MEPGTQHTRSGATGRITSRITSIVAHIDHGKTTLMDSLVASQGCISRSLAGELRYLDSRADEQSRQITLKLSFIGLSSGHVFIDTPGHVDFESLVLCASVLADNHLILIDASEGITPRTYSLVRFIDRARSILVLNKIDRCSDYDSIQLIVHQINGLVGETVFSWDRNNIVLCCASLCCGLTRRLFHFGKKNSLKTALAAFNQLNKKYDEDDVADLMKKYKIRHKSRKGIFSTVLPLDSAIIDAVECLYDNIDGAAGTLNYQAQQAPDISADTHVGASADAPRAPLWASPYFSVAWDEQPAVLGITTYGVFAEKEVYRRDNVLFIVKLFRGQLSVGATVWSVSDTACKQSRIEAIYTFATDHYVRRDRVDGPVLCCIMGDFLKNSAISDVPLRFSMKSFFTPFYQSTLALHDLSRLESLKETIRAISYTEQCLKARKNKYSEIEIRCSGRVHFEKFCADLAIAGYGFDIKSAKKDFREAAGEGVTRHYKGEAIEFIIKISPTSAQHSAAQAAETGMAETAPAEHALVKDKPNGNRICIISCKSTHIIESVLEIILDSGPLIREPVMNTAVYVQFIQESDNSIYNVLRNELLDLYMESEPRLCPRLFSVRVSIDQAFIGLVYSTAQKYRSQIVSEEFDEETGFFILVFRTAQYILDEFIEQIHIKTKGTAYFEVSDSSYSAEGDFSSLVEPIRAEKGLSTVKKIVENPEKQRTHRR